MEPRGELGLEFIRGVAVAHAVGEVAEALVGVNLVAALQVVAARDGCVEVGVAQVEQQARFEVMTVAVEVVNVVGAVLAADAFVVFAEAHAAALTDVVAKEAFEEIGEAVVQARGVVAEDVGLLGVIGGAFGVAVAEDDGVLVLEAQAVDAARVGLLREDVKGLLANAVGIGHEGAGNGPRHDGVGVGFEEERAFDFRGDDTRRADGALLEEVARNERDVLAFVECDAGAELVGPGGAGAKAKAVGKLAVEVNAADACIVLLVEAVVARIEGVERIRLKAVVERAGHEAKQARCVAEMGVLADVGKTLAADAIGLEFLVIGEIGIGVELQVIVAGNSEVSVTVAAKALLLFEHEAGEPVLRLVAGGSAQAALIEAAATLAARHGEAVEDVHVDVGIADPVGVPEQVDVVGDLGVVLVAVDVALALVLAVIVVLLVLLTGKDGLGGFAIGAVNFGNVTIAVANAVQHDPAAMASVVKLVAIFGTDADATLAEHVHVCVQLAVGARARRGGVVPIGDFRLVDVAVAEAVEEAEAAAVEAEELGPGGAFRQVA